MLRRTGHNLIELIYVLIILSILGGVATQSLTRARDEMAVQTVATTLVAELSRVRTLAVLHGGARMLVDLRAARLQVSDLAENPLVSWVEVGGAQGVQMSLASGADSIALSFDARGLGRMTSATFELRRGSARAGVVVSAYGRVRQW